MAVLERGSDKGIQGPPSHLWSTDMKLGLKQIAGSIQDGAVWVKARSYPLTHLCLDEIFPASWWQKLSELCKSSSWETSSSSGWHRGFSLPFPLAWDSWGNASVLGTSVSILVAKGRRPCL